MVAKVAPKPIISEIALTAIQRTQSDRMIESIMVIILEKYGAHI
jgi:hypothetical protein